MPRLQDTPWLIPQESFMDSVLKGAHVGNQIYQTQQANRERSNIERYQAQQNARAQEEFQRKADEEARRLIGLKDFQNEVEQLQNFGNTPQEAHQIALLKHGHKFLPPAATASMFGGIERANTADELRLSRESNAEANRTLRDQINADRLSESARQADAKAADKKDADTQRFLDKVDLLKYQSAPSWSNRADYQNFKAQVALIAKDETKTIPQRQAAMDDLWARYEASADGKPLPPTKELTPQETALSEVEKELQEAEIKRFKSGGPGAIESFFGEDSEAKKIKALQEKRDKLRQEINPKVRREVLQSPTPALDVPDTKPKAGDLNPVYVKTKEGVKSLPSGTPFIWTDGKLYYAK